MPDRTAKMQNRIDELEGMLGMQSRFTFSIRLKVGQIPEKLIGMLMSFPRVSAKAAFAALYGQQCNKPTFNVLSVHIVRVRKILAQLGIKVQTLHSFGWALDPRDREKLKRMEL